jgi:transcriptional regulator with XRE-family HTH domain
MRPIGEVIREQRKRQNLSATYVANKAQIAKSTLCDIEKGRLTPSIKTLSKISNALGCNLFIMLDPENLTSLNTNPKLPSTY